MFALTSFLLWMSINNGSIHPFTTLLVSSKLEVGLSTEVRDVGCRLAREGHVRIRGQSAVSSSATSLYRDRDDGFRRIATGPEVAKPSREQASCPISTYHQIYLSHCNQRVASADSYSLTEL